MSTIHRREFLQSSAATLAAAGAFGVMSEQAIAESNAASEKLTAVVMGVNGRGGALCNAFLGQPNVEIAYLADVDSNALDRVTKAVSAKQGKAPQGVIDFRKALDDKSVDILICAAPNHWHAPATILGCSAGKHVYVEKPCSHNPQEGEWAVQAARKNKRVVQMGSQRRSYQAIREGIGKLHAGELGRVLYARTWYANRRPEIGHGKPATVPTWLNWELWQGPAPEKPYMDNIVHYKWHWKWHWGNGELGNNGIHALDVARWGLGVDYPTRVSAGGGKYRWDDDQETLDTHMVVYDFGDRDANGKTTDGKTILWEGLSWTDYGPGGSTFGVSFHGEKGSMVMGDNGYTIFDEKNKETSKNPGKGDGMAAHVDNFLTCIRGGKGDLPNADIEQGHKSTLLCHLGNIAARTSSVLTCDPTTGHILNNEKAAAMWRREYRPGWEPKV
ncbi:MAG: Gfo/Idh/MocA family oxidoreductase [Planctomycetales bacterium]|nr:Gfo/Idh/MocA family oxidoreductase [Planctomycetales bacterium]